jgi:Predicted glycosyltransferases
MKSDKTEKCSVIVLNYNGKQFLEECLESLRNQTYADCKVYVLDNASTDGSVQFLHEHFPEVAVIEAAENFGTAQGSNEGVKNTGGEYVVLMSNDIKADPQCIAYLMQTIEQDPSIGICSSKLVRYYPDPQTGKYLVDNAGGIIDRFAFAMPLRNNTMNDEAEKGVREVFFSYGGCFVIKREVFNKVGGFDDKFFTLSDDVDLSWRIWLAGYKVAVNPAAFIYHKVSATLGGDFFPEKRNVSGVKEIICGRC